MNMRRSHSLLNINVRCLHIKVIICSPPIYDIDQRYRQGNICSRHSEKKVAGDIYGVPKSIYTNKGSKDNKDHGSSLLLLVLRLPLGFICQALG